METDQIQKPQSASPGFLKKGYWYLTQTENCLRHLLLLFMRLYWGFLLISAGIGKWVHINDIGDYFATLGLPYPFISAYAAATIELLGGASLVLGLVSRFFSLLLTVLFFVAYKTAHHDALIQFFDKPSLFIQQEPFLYLLTSLIVLSFGPGIFSFDYWMEKKQFGKAC